MKKIVLSLVSVWLLLCACARQQSQSKSSLPAPGGKYHGIAWGASVVAFAPTGRKPEKFILAPVS